MYSVNTCIRFPSTPADDSIRMFLTEQEALDHMDRTLTTGAAAARRNWRENPAAHTVRASVTGPDGALIHHRALTVHPTGVVKEVHGRIMPGEHSMDWNYRYGDWSDAAAATLPYTAFLTAAGA